MLLCVSADVSLTLNNKKKIMEHKVSSPCSQQPATFPSPEADQSSPFSPTLILSSYLHLGLPSNLLHSGVPNITLYAPLLYLTHATCPELLIFLHFITQICSEQYTLWRSLRSLLLYPASWGQIPSSATYTWTPAAYVPPSVWETKFHTQKNKQNHSSGYFNLYRLKYQRGRH